MACGRIHQKDYSQAIDSRLDGKLSKEQATKEANELVESMLAKAVPAKPECSEECPNRHVAITLRTRVLRVDPFQQVTVTRPGSTGGGSGPHQSGGSLVRRLWWTVTGQLDFGVEVFCLADDEILVSTEDSTGATTGPTGTAGRCGFIAGDGGFAIGISPKVFYPKDSPTAEADALSHAREWARINARDQGVVQQDRLINNITCQTRCPNKVYTYYLSEPTSYEDKQWVNRYGDASCGAQSIAKISWGVSVFCLSANGRLQVARG